LNKNNQTNEINEVMGINLWVYLTLMVDFYIREMDKKQDEK